MLPPVQVWQFYGAPKELRDLSPNQGDEDHVVFIPKEQVNNWGWMEDRIGFSHTCKVTMPDGSIVLFGCHA